MWDPRRLTNQWASTAYYRDTCTLFTEPWRHMGEWKYSYINFDPGTRWRWVVSFAPLPLYSREKNHWIWGWVGPRTDLDTMEERKILTMPGIEPGRPAHSPSLYRLSYPCSSWSEKCQWIKEEKLFLKHWAIHSHNCNFGVVRGLIIGAPLVSL
jgi:hypothetical protein